MAKLLTLVTLAALAAPVLAQSQSSAAQTTHGRLHFAPPAEWATRPTTSMMRVAQFALPKADGDPEDAELVVYYFGGTGGTVQANIDRWLGQMAQPDGRPTRQVATITERRVNALSMTIVDASGTLVAEVSPGSTERFNKPGFRLRAVVVATPNGPYFVRVVGPAATVAHWSAQIDEFLGSIRFGS